MCGHVSLAAARRLPRPPQTRMVCRALQRLLHTHTYPPALCPPPAHQDARLNYLEQHAARLGGDEAAGALEGARLAAARSSPLSDALDLLARWVGGGGGSLIWMPWGGR